MSVSRPASTTADAIKSQDTIESWPGCVPAEDGNTDVSRLSFVSGVGIDMARAASGVAELVASTTAGSGADVDVADGSFVGDAKAVAVGPVVGVLVGAGA